MSVDLPLPTIAVSQLSPVSPAHTPLLHPDIRGEYHQAMLAPFSSASLRQLIGQPKTPTAQLDSLFDDGGMYIANDFRVTRLQHGTDIDRPSSAWSEVSDSSISSVNSAASPPSYAPSCTSPESDHADPFITAKPHHAKASLASPMRPVKRRPRRSRSAQSQNRTTWTSEMDEHLWTTYVIYSSDPTVTPFKILPGTAPPLGVCHRVARQAKRSWKGTRVPVTSIDEGDHLFDRFGIARRGSTIPLVTLPNPRSEALRRPSSTPRSHSSGEVTRRALQKWPQTASATRRRLRDLCKRKAFIPTHYQRLIQARTPSPFEPIGSDFVPPTPKLPAPAALQSQRTSTAFSTRDLNIGLAASTAASMQPDGPLARLAGGYYHSQSTANTIRPIPQVNGHQKSQSLHASPNWFAQQASSDHHKLASPFQEKRKRFHDRDAILPSPLSRDESDAQTMEIHAPRPLSGSMKRRTQYALGQAMGPSEDARPDFLHELFHKPIDNGHQRVRSRGFSMSAMRQVSAARQLSDVFRRPSDMAVDDGNGNPQGNLLSAPAIDASARLGSPFSPGNAQSSFSRTFPRNSFPLGLDSLASLHDPFVVERSPSVMHDSP